MLIYVMEENFVLYWTKTIDRRGNFENKLRKTDEKGKWKGSE